MSLDEIKIPDYSTAEDRTNSISHLVGAAFSVAVLIMCLFKAIANGSAWQVAASVIYGLSMIILYSSSAFYHGLKPGRLKKIMRIIDHCMIFLLIAGTVTPYTLVALRGVNPAIAWAMFGIAWGSAILGILLTCLGFERFKAIQMFLYIAIGWVMLFAIKTFLAVFTGPTRPGLLLLIAGGAVYTVGAIFYGIGKKVPYAHALFHLFVLAGSILHFVSIYCYVLIS